MTRMADPTRLFHAAAVAGDAETVEKLLADGVAIDAVDGQRRTAILLGAVHGHLEVVRLLIDRGADIDLQDAMRLNPFLHGCMSNDLALVRTMLAAGADVDRLTRFGGVAVHPPAEKGHVELVRLLVTTTQVNVNHTNWVGWTPLLEAIVLRDGGPDQQEIVRLLLDHGASPHLTDKYGRTPLDLARERGFDEIAALLVGAGA
jgi:uncharacterized protein